MNRIRQDVLERVDGRSPTAGSFTPYRYNVESMADLLISMNASHSEELGDFGFGREDLDSIAQYLRSKNIRKVNTGLLNILERVQVFIEEGDPESTLELKTRYDADGRMISLKGTYYVLRGFVRRNETNRGPCWCFGLRSLLHSLPEDRVNLVRLNLKEQGIDDAAAVQLSRALQGLPTLTELDLSCNGIGNDGALAIFSDLLGHPSCVLREVDLSWNREIDNQPNPMLQQRLIDALLQNKSLIQLNLTGTGFKPSAELAQVFYDASDEGSLFEIPNRYNNHLRVLALGGGVSSVLMLQSALDMNEGSSEEAVARKIDDYLERNQTKVFEENGDPIYVMQTLAFVGRHGTLQALVKSVQLFTAIGSLFGTV